jgi:hypothetical protein
MEKNESGKTRVSFKKPLVIFTLPFILYLPTLWFLTVYLPEHAQAPERFGGVQEMRRVWGAYFIVFYFGFTVICFLWALIVYIFRLRQRR